MIIGSNDAANITTNSGLDVDNQTFRLTLKNMNKLTPHKFEELSTEKITYKWTNNFTANVTVNTSDNATATVNASDNATANVTVNAIKVYRYSVVNASDNAITVNLD